MEIDGKSYIKFYELTRDYDTTILVIKDECGYVFGGVVQESWKLSYRFYGNGAEVLFTFKDGDFPMVFNWSGKWKGAGAGQHQYSDDRSLGIAGDEDGNYGIFISNDFDHGMSKRSKLYDND